MPIRFLAIVAFLVPSASGLAPTLEVSTSVDNFEFNNMDDVYFYRGYTIIRCNLPGCISKITIELVQVDGDISRVIGSQVSQDCIAVFSIPHYNLSLIPHKCQVGKEQSANSFSPATRFCPDQSEMCKNEKTCNKHSFCIETRRTHQHLQTSCGKIATNLQKEKQCPEEPTRPKLFCPVDAKSLCIAISKNYSRTWARILLGKQCAADAAIPRLAIGGEIYAYDQPIKVDKLSVATISFTRNKDLINLILHCMFLKGADSKISIPGGASRYEKIRAETWSKTLKFGDYPLFDQLQLLKLECEFADEHDRQTVYAILRYTLVVADLSVFEIKSWTVHGAAMRNMSMVNCTIPATNDFLVSYQWVNEKNEEISKQPVLLIDKAGQYTCKISAAYKTCSPHFSTTVERSVSWSTGSTDPTTTGSSSSSTSPTDPITTGRSSSSTSPTDALTTESSSSSTTTSPTDSVTTGSSSSSTSPTDPITTGSISTSTSATELILTGRSSSTSLISEQRPELNVKHLNMFGRATDGTIYGDDETIFECWSNTDCKKLDKYEMILIEIDDEKMEPWATTDKCQKNKPMVFEFDQRYLPLAVSYKCREWNEQSDETFDSPSVRLCSDHSKMCMKETSCGEHNFCIEEVSERKFKTSCGKIQNSQQCQELMYYPELYFCPVQAPSFCEAIKKNYSGAWAYTLGEDCDAEEAIPRLTVGDKIYAYDQPIKVNRKTEATISFRNNSKLKSLFLDCTFYNSKRKSIQIPENIYTGEDVPAETWSKTFKFGEFPFFERLQLIQMECEFRKRKRVNAQLRYVLVVVEGPEPNIKRKESKSPIGNVSLKCAMPISSNFDVRYAWLNEKDEEISKNQVLVIGTGGKYDVTCKIKATYKTCSPHFNTTVETTKRYRYSYGPNATTTTAVSASTSTNGETTQKHTKPGGMTRTSAWPDEEETTDLGHACIPSLSVVICCLLVIIQKQVLRYLYAT